MDRWENLQDIGTWGGAQIASARIKVPGGYIYRTIVASGFSSDKDVAVVQTFVPNPVPGAAG